MLPRAERIQSLPGYRVGAEVQPEGAPPRLSAVHLGSGREVVLQPLSIAERPDVSRLTSGVAQKSPLPHRNLAGVVEVFFHEPHWWVALEPVQGQPILEWIRQPVADLHGAQDGNHLFDETRLRRALCDVARGLAALHAASVAHGDLRPANVTVDAEERAVLTGFALGAAPVSGKSSGDSRQAAGQNEWLAQDLRALGACLHEALFGRPPSDVETPSSGEASDLVELCLRLLDPDPGRRPRAQRVVEMLEPTLPSARASLRSGRSLSPRRQLWGRDDVLDALHDTLTLSQHGEFRLVLLDGEPGLGRTALLDELARRLSRNQQQTLVLRGRCYPDVLAPYGALTPCIDGLAAALRGRKQRSARGARLPCTAPLAALFPELGELSPHEGEVPERAGDNPEDRRLAAAETWVSLWRLVALERPLILVLDDLQWADVDSLQLLRALADHPEAPPMLVLATSHPTESLQGEGAPHVTALGTHRHAQRFVVGPLSKGSARRLVSSRLGRGVSRERVNHIADACGGHPLWSTLQCRVVAERGQEDGAKTAGVEADFDALLDRVVDGLPTGAAQLLNLLAVSVRPLAAGVLKRALGRDPGADVECLVGWGLVERNSAGRLWCAHHQVRRRVRARMRERESGHGDGPEQLHRTLLHALRDEGPLDLAEQALHLEQAGDPEPSRVAYGQAAERANAALAFHSAAALYGRAQVAQSSSAAPLAFAKPRAAALASAGRHVEAAGMLEQAVPGTEGPALARLLCARAQSLLRGGQLIAGLELSTATLAQAQVHAESEPGWIRRRWGTGERFASARSLQGSFGAKGELSESQALRLELSSRLAPLLLAVHPRLGRAANAEQLRLSFAAGDTVQALAALAQQLTTQLRTGCDEAELTRLVDLTAELAEGCERPDGRALLREIQGAHCLGSGKLEQAERCFADADALWAQTAHCPGQQIRTRVWLSDVRYQRGEHAVLAQDTAHWEAHVCARGDALERALLVGPGRAYLRHLMRDDPAAARDQLNQTLRVPDGASSPAVNWLVLEGLCETALYDGEGARQQLERAAQALEAQSACALVVGAQLRPRLRAQALLLALPELDGRARAHATRELGREVRALSALGPVAAASAALLEAQAAAVAGHTDEAVEKARNAEQWFEALGHVQRLGASYLVGVVTGGDRGRVRRETVLNRLRTQGWARPERAVRMWVPALFALDHEAPVQVPGADLLGGRFRVETQLGRGAFGEVTRAEDQRTGRIVAVKQLKHQGATALLHFKHEFRALQGLHHPNVARLEALFEQDGRWFIAMQFVPGSDLMSWVRSGERANAARLREAFAGVASGLDALHGAGFCHRDIKPDNVRVTPEGRAVVLDFGLVSQVNGRGGAGEDGVVGTPAYMAPELTRGEQATPSADMYALGVCLFQALTGMMPFQAGEHTELDDATMSCVSLANSGPLPSRSQRPPSLALEREDVAPELGRLCDALLDPDPTARPSAAEVRDLFVQTAEAALVSVQPAALPRHATFVGRASELAVLRERFEHCRAGHLSVALLSGPSGIGKSAVVEELLKSVTAEQPGAVVLTGRCFENEQVPYKALDGLMDQLARRLRLRSVEQCNAILPEGAAVLAQLFPALGSVQAIGEAPRKGLLADPVARRRQGFEALAQLLRNLCTQAPLVLAVDDLQWADLESFRLLGSLFGGEGPPPLLFVATVRPEAELTEPMAEALAELSALPSTTRLEIGPLPPDEARALATTLLGDAATATQLDEMVSEGHGHPLFLAELSHHGLSSLGKASDGLTLDAAVAARVHTLPASALQLLQMIALAGRPYGLHVYVRALASGADERATEMVVEAALGRLSTDQMVRLREGQAPICYHDRIRAAAEQSMGDEQRRQLLRSLAEAVEAEPGIDAADRAGLWDAAGETLRAARAYEEAADSALQALAFAHAEQLYARALALTPIEDEETRQRQTVQRGHALARGGRSAEAAAVYREAASAAEGEMRVRLGIWIAQQLLRSAQMEEGLAAARRVLSELGIPLAKGPVAALARVSADRLVLSVRGMDVKSSARRRSLDTEQRLMLEAVWCLGLELGWVELLPAAALNVAHLRRALSAGDASHAARALAHEAAVGAFTDPSARRADELLERSRRLAQHLDDPSFDALTDWVAGQIASFRYDLESARKHLVSAERTLREQCDNEGWMLTNVRFMLGSTWTQLGMYRTLAEHMHTWFAEAREANDIFTQTALAGIGMGYIRHLMADRPDVAFDELEATMAFWPREQFTVPHIGEVNARVMIELYRAQGGAASYLETEKTRLDRAFVLKHRSGRGLLATVRAHSALESLAQGRGDPSALRRQIEHSVKTLAAMGPAPMTSGSLLLRAQRCMLDGDSDRAIQLTRETRDAYTTGGRLNHYVCTYLEGVLLGGDAGRECRQQALQYFEEAGWQDPERGLRTYLPALRQ